MKEDLSGLVTEQINPKTVNLDQLSTEEILTRMNDEDRTVADAVREAIPQIEEAVETIYNALRSEGRLFYVGAGTSGRLGIVDASECPPTFRTPPELVQGLIAGGEGALIRAVEGAEDDPDLGAQDLRDRGLSDHDVVVGIAASGRTPYVVGALSYSKKIGAATVAIACNTGSAIGQIADHPIEVVVGPEIVMGSTRLKAATAQKLVLNMISTTTMIKLGKVYRNLMVDLQASNGKLVERACHIVRLVTGVTEETAKSVLKETGQHVKPALVMIEAGVSYKEAQEAIEAAGGYVRQAIEWAISRRKS